MRRQAIMVEDHFAAGRARPIPRFKLAELRRALKLLLADINFVAAQLRIVSQQRPWQRIVVLAYPHESSETHDGISDLATQLVDHHVLDPTEAISLGPKNRRSLHLVAANQHRGFALIKSRGLSIPVHVILLGLPVIPQEKPRS